MRIEETMSSLVDTLFGSGSDLSALQMSLRTVAVFSMTLGFIRIAGRSSFGQHRPFDACTTVLLGSVLSRAVVGASPFWPTMCAGAVIVVMHRAIALVSLYWPSFEVAVAGRERELVRRGRTVRDQMRKGLVTQRDLDEAVRKKVGAAGAPLERAVLERDGVITVKLKTDD
jgi:uncharacterized membrane protein YcaP (DUF421 family)